MGSRSSPSDELVTSTTLGACLDQHLTAEQVTKLRTDGYLNRLVPEKIIGHRTILGTRQFLVKFAAHEPVLALYKSESECTFIRDMLLKYLQRNGLEVSHDTPPTPNNEPESLNSTSSSWSCWEVTDEELNIPSPGEIILYVHQQRRQIGRRRNISDLVLEQYPGQEELRSSREERLFLILLHGVYFIYHFLPKHGIYTIADGNNSCHNDSVLSDHEHITGHRLNRLTCRWQKGEDHSGSTAVMIALWIMRERAQGRKLQGFIGVTSKRFKDYLVKKMHIGNFKPLPGPKMTSVKPEPCRYCEQKGRRKSFKKLSSLISHQRRSHPIELENDKV